MAITLNGNGTITGISVGGLPDCSVDADTLASGTIGIKVADLWRLNTGYSIPNNSEETIATTNWERPDTANDGFGQLGTGMSVNSSDHAAGIWTFPSTGFYLVSFGSIVYNGATDATEVYVDMQFTEDGSTFTTHSRAFGGGERFNYNGFFGQALVDVTNTSNVKMRLRVYSSVGSSTLQGSTSANRTYLSFIKLGDT